MNNFTEINTFEYDLDKITDLMDMVMGTMTTNSNNAQTINIQKGMKDFLTSYSYLTMEEIKATIDKLGSETLADLMRMSENLYIENMNDRPSLWNVTGEQAKVSVSNYAQFMLSTEQYNEYIELCNSMGV